MRRWIVVLLCVLMPLAARANPYIVNPSSLIAFAVVAFMALIVEAGVVALVLAFAGLTPLRMFVA
jgi:membrane protein YdbS with pleckstrin-like domain